MSVSVSEATPADPRRYFEHIGAERDEFCCVRPKTVGVALAPTVIDLQIASGGPTELLQPLDEHSQAALNLGVIRAKIREHTDAPHPFLRVRGERPQRSHATNQAYEFPPPHVRPRDSTQASYRLKRVL